MFDKHTPESLTVLPLAGEPEFQLESIIPKESARVASTTLSAPTTLASARDGYAGPLLSKEESNDLGDSTLLFFGSLSDGRGEK